MPLQRAVIVEKRGHVRVADDVPIPELPDTYILVKTQAVALNPTDWKHVDFEPCTGTLVGCDYAGVVEAVGPAVKKPWKQGDRVAGFVHGCDLMHAEGGAFAQYVMAKGDIQFRVPDWMPIEDAACLGVGTITVGQNLFQSLELGELQSLVSRCQEYTRHPDEAVPTLLIYGGGTATGSLAIQFAKLSGARVITTCSEGNRARMHQLGADAVFDYHDPHVGDQIREATDDALELVLDTISTVQSATVCAAAIGTTGGCYNALLDVRCPRADVDTHVSMAYDLIGESYQMGGQVIEGDLANLSFAIQWATTVDYLLHTRRVIPHPAQVKPGGLAGIPVGLDLLREGKVSGCKLVYRIDEI